MEEKLNLLKALLAEVANLTAANAILNWDQLVNMPGGAAEDRGEQIATLENIAHAKATSDELGKLLDDLAGETQQMDPESDEVCLIRQQNATLINRPKYLRNL